MTITEAYTELTQSLERVKGCRSFQLANMNEAKNIVTNLLESTDIVVEKSKISNRQHKYNLCFMFLCLGIQIGVLIKSKEND